ncbi:hypothetical protein CRYUN_Cryun06bG0055300 [Craigia yunnanensis]
MIPSYGKELPVVFTLLNSFVRQFIIMFIMIKNYGGWFGPVLLLQRLKHFVGN